MHLLASIFLTLTLGISYAQAAPSVTDIGSQIQQQLETANKTLASEQKQSLHATELVSRFYSGRTYLPAWLDEEGLLPRAKEMILAIKNADAEGMNPEDYHFSLIRSLLIDLVKENGWQDGDEPALARLEILCTDAFITYAAHLAYGRFNPETVYESWQISRDNVDPVSLLNHALESGQVGAALKEQMPKHPIYAVLKQYLARYRQIAASGGWSAVDSDQKMESGDQGPHVRQLRDRLFITGELSEFNGKDIFDDDLTLAVIKFQATHGLGMDGIVGQKTLAALNVPVRERVRQIELNMERWRWLPRQLGDRYIHVNITDFSLSIIEQGKTVVSMPVIVGRQSRSTPEFSADMTYMVVNPYWKVPRKLAVQDKLPLIRKDPEYLLKHNFRVYQWYNGEAVELDPYSINWSKVNSRNWNFSLRQDPGPDNALGSLKFMLPNKFSVYLHDTPTQHLFEQDTRAFSSGCIRIASPIELAKYLLKDDPYWDLQTIMGAIAGGENEIINLPKPIPVYVLYWTAWVGEDGRIQFRDDIYGRDTLLAEAESVTNVTDLIAFSSSNQPLN